MKEVSYYKNGQLVTKKFGSVKKANRYLNKKGIYQAYYRGLLFVTI